MKLIIDITELMWERLKKHSLNWGDIEDIKDSIREGTPLDDLRAEISEFKDDKIIHAERNEMIDIVLEIIDKYNTESNQQESEV